MGISIETYALAKKFTEDYVAKHSGGGGDPDLLGDLALKDSASGKYTPAGSISKPNVTISSEKKTVTPIKSVGTLPSLTTTVSNKNLRLQFDQGSLPEKDIDVEVLTDAAAELDANPSFTGTETTITVK